MALKTRHQNTVFGVGDRVKVTQKVKEGEKTRFQALEGMVIGIKGRGDNQTFTVRRIGVGQVGIERIFPIASPTIEKVEVVKSGVSGVRRAKLYYVRDQSRKEIEKIYSRAAKRKKAKIRAKSVASKTSSKKK